MSAPRIGIPIAAAALMLAVSSSSLQAAAARSAPAIPSMPAAVPAHRVICDAAIQHPIAVSITPLDIVRRGQPLRLRVDLRPERAVERAEVRVSSSGGAAVTGGRSVPLRAVPAGGQAQADFMFIVPSSGNRCLIQFEIDAEGASGRSHRGVTFNLLPDGPNEHPRVVRSANGESITEVAARKVTR